MDLSSFRRNRRSDIESGEDSDILQVPRSSYNIRNNRPSHSSTSNNIVEQGNNSGRQTSYRKKFALNRIQISSSRTPTPYTESDSDNETGSSYDDDDLDDRHSNYRTSSKSGDRDQNSSSSLSPNYSNHPRHHNTRSPRQPEETLPYANAKNPPSSAAIRQNSSNPIRNNNAFSDFNHSTNNHNHTTMSSGSNKRNSSSHRQPIAHIQHHPLTTVNPYHTTSNTKDPPPAIVSSSAKTNGVNHNGVNFHSKVTPTNSNLRNHHQPADTLFAETDLNAITQVSNHHHPHKSANFTRNGKISNHSSKQSKTNNGNHVHDFKDGNVTNFLHHPRSNGVVPGYEDGAVGNSSHAPNNTSHYKRHNNVNPSLGVEKGGGGCVITSTSTSANNARGKLNNGTGAGGSGGNKGNLHNNYASNHVANGQGNMRRGNSTDKNNKNRTSATQEPGGGNYDPPPTWKLKLKAYMTFLSALLLIFSCSSLLFIFPLVVDPIVFGLQAQFSEEPVQCKTVSYRNETGPENCTEPSCREGCTVDLYSCYYIVVEYRIGFYADHPPSNSNFSDLNTTQSQPLSTNLTKKYFTPTNDETYVATLRVNPNGCGYPPDVICSEFNRSYGEVDTIFPCYYSQIPIATVSNNESVAVVPHYNRDTEVMHLTAALGIPLGLVFSSAALLFILVRWHPRAQRRKKDRNQKSMKRSTTNEEFDNVPDMPGSSSSSDAILQPSESSAVNHNGFLPKANGHIEKTVSGLMGFAPLPYQQDTRPLYENLPTVPSNNSSYGNRNGKIKT